MNSCLVISYLFSYHCHHILPWWITAEPRFYVEKGGPNSKVLLGRSAGQRLIPKDFVRTMYYMGKFNFHVIEQALFMYRYRTVYRIQGSFMSDFTTVDY